MMVSFSLHWINLVFFLIIVDIKAKISSSKFQCANTQTNIVNPRWG